MPEGPEILFYYKNFVATLKKQILTNLSILSGRYINHPNIPNLSLFQHSLPLRVLDTGVKGKNIWILFDNNMSLYFTHGMTGRWSLDKDDIHNRIELKFNDRTLYFNDMRGFGTITIATNKKQLQDKLDTLGINAMSLKSTDEKSFLDALFVATNLNKPIGKILLEQKYISGIGNYLRAEILWDIYISPYKLLKDFTNIQKHLLFVATRKLLNYHYKYITKHNTHHYQKRNESFKVYSRNLDINGFPVIHEKLGSQTIHWVKDRQNQ